MSLTRLPQNRNKERIIFDYLLNPIRNTLVQSLHYLCPSPILAQREVSEGFQLLVAAVSFAPAHYIICSDRVIPQILEF